MSTDEISIDGASGEAPVDRRPRIALRPHLELPWLVLPEGLSLQMLMDVVPVRVPNTRSWFHGVLSQRGNLMPVFDLGHWAGLAPIDRRQAHVVAIGQGAQACALLCATAPNLVTTNGDSWEQSDAGTLAPYLGKATASGYGPVYEFDVYRWLTDASQHVSSSTSLTAAH
jgi:chemotaxis signal transduction protein